MTRPRLVSILSNCYPVKPKISCGRLPVGRRIQSQLQGTRYKRCGPCAQLRFALCPETVTQNAYAAQQRIGGQISEFRGHNEFTNSAHSEFQGHSA